MTKRLLLIDNAIDENYRPAEDWARWITLPTDVVRAAAEPLSADPDAYSHVLFTGGLPSAREDTDWMRRERRFMLEMVEADKNVLCVCFGFQLLAQALFGMDAVRARAAQGAAPELGWAKVTVSKDDPLLGQKDSAYWGYVSHFDDVCRIDETAADVVAASDACAIHGFKLKRKNVWGLQAHFEIDIEAGKRYNAMFTAAFPQLDGIILRPPRDSGFIRELMPRFERL